MKKNKSKCIVLMVGPAESVKGGIRTVVNQYLSYENWNDVELLYIPTYLEGGTLKKVTYFAMQMFKIMFVCVTKRVDILHMNVSERGSFWRKAVLLCICRKLRIKTILHHHGAEFIPFYENASAACKKLIAGLIGLADRNLVLSQYHCQMMQERFPEGDFEVLYNAVPATECIAYNPDAKGILLVGRLGKRKGTYDFISVWEEIEHTLPVEIKVYFCGDGDVEEVRQLLCTKNLGHRIAHIGWCSKEQLHQFYRQAMLFILPSYREGLPMSLLEAMWAGLPCITTNVDGIPEAIQSGYNGLLVEPGNMEQIKKALQQLIRDAELRKTLGENARCTVQQQFSLQQHIENLKTMYLELKGDNYV